MADTGQLPSGERHELKGLRTLLADLLPHSPGREPAQAGDGVDRRAKKSG